MGLSFHYKGALKKPKSLKPMIEEVVDIAKANQWEYDLFEETFPNDSFSEDAKNDTLFGVCISPPNCEVVCFTFLSNGKMGNFFHINQPFSKNESDEPSLFVKTQFAGATIHKQLITIFDYLSKKYLENFELYDEGNYWETKNEQLLDETFAKYTNLMDGFSSLLENIPMNENETIEDYLLRIAEMNQKKNEGQ